MTLLAHHQSSHPFHVYGSRTWTKNKLPFPSVTMGNYLSEIILFLISLSQILPTKIYLIVIWTISNLFSNSENV